MTFPITSLISLSMLLITYKIVEYILCFVCVFFFHIGRVQYYYVELFIIYKLYKLKVVKLIRNMIVYVFINLRSDLKNSRFLDSEKLSDFSFVNKRISTWISNRWLRWSNVSTHIRWRIQAPSKINLKSLVIWLSFFMKIMLSKTSFSFQKQLSYHQLWILFWQISIQFYSITKGVKIKDPE